MDVFQRFTRKIGKAWFEATMAPQLVSEQLTVVSSTEYLVPGTKPLYDSYLLASTIVVDEHTCLHTRPRDWLLALSDRFFSVHLTIVIEVNILLH